MKPLVVEGPIDLSIKGQPDRQDKVLVRSQSIETTHEQGQMTQEREETVEFTLAIKTTEVKPGQEIHQDISVIEKNGTVDLHSMAYPELGETLNVIMTPDARILKSGDKPKDSIFFIPPIPIPDKPVPVGDTWTKKWEWVASSGIPLQLDLIGIVKGVYPCGGTAKKSCVLVELSGDVAVRGQALVGLALESKISGYIFYEPATGSVIWSDIRNKESLVSDGGNRVDIDSCLESVLVEPKEDRWVHSAKPTCGARTDSLGIKLFE
jgi:hypothetical protein